MPPSFIHLAEGVGWMVPEGGVAGAISPTFHSLVVSELDDTMYTRIMSYWPSVYIMFLTREPLLPFFPGYIVVAIVDDLRPTSIITPYYLALRYRLLANVS